MEIKNFKGMQKYIYISKYIAVEIFILNKTLFNVGLIFDPLQINTVSVNRLLKPTERLNGAASNFQCGKVQVGKDQEKAQSEKDSFQVQPRRKHRGWDPFFQNHSYSVLQDIHFK